MYGKKEKKCECIDQCVDSDSVNYIGPNLPGTGIQTNTNLTVSLEMIDYEILDIKEELFNLTTNKIEADAAIAASIKKANVITINSSYSVVGTDFAGTNGEVDVLIDASAGAVTLTLASIPISQGYKVTVIRLDNSSNSVFVRGRLVGSSNEPINGDIVNSYRLAKNLPATFIAGDVLGTVGYGWWTSTSPNVVQTIYTGDTTSTVTLAFLNSTYPYQKYPTNRTVIVYYNQGKSYERVGDSSWVSSIVTTVT